MIQEFDTVRIAELTELDREYDGTKNIKRAPRVGDIAVVVHEYEPNNPDAKVAVEMIDESGNTIWLADFDKDELEFISRPK